METPKVDQPKVVPTSSTSTDQGATGATATTDTNSKKKKPKAEKKTKDNGKEKKGAGGPEVPVDISWLDLRIGRIIRAWKHPDADSLYVEEGVYCFRLYS